MPDEILTSPETAALPNVAGMIPRRMAEKWEPPGLGPDWYGRFQRPDVAAGSGAPTGAAAGGEAPA